MTNSGEVEIVGWVTTQEGSETIAPVGPPFQPDYIARAARVHEEAGFDRVLIGYYTDGADGFLTAGHVAASTERLGLLLAHRPGFVAPTLAARKLATLDVLSRGRAAVHIISGGSTADQARDGDFADHAARYRRSAEYVALLRRTWSSSEPFDHEGEFYRVERASSAVRPYHGASLPVYGGGGSDAAIDLLAPQLDTFMIWGEPLADAAAVFAQVRAVAGPQIGFSVSTRPIVAATEGAAWDRAHAILDQIEARNRTRTGVARPSRRPENAGSRRLLDAAARGEVHDRCLWTALAEATGAAGNSTALVGTAETVAAAMADYAELGATTLLIRGYDPLVDAAEWGRELIPRVRAVIADRRAAAARA